MRITLCDLYHCLSPVSDPVRSQANFVAGFAISSVVELKLGFCFLSAQVSLCPSSLKLWSVKFFLHVTASTSSFSVL